MAKTITFKNNLKKKPNAKITKITVYNRIIYQADEQDIQIHKPTRS